MIIWKDGKMIENKPDMTVRELLAKPIEIDVVDDVVEQLYIAFCGPMKLTQEGQKKFSEVLDYPVTFNLHSWVGELAIIGVDDECEDVWEHRLQLAKQLFYGMAGYCDADDYDRWFEEVEA